MFSLSFPHALHNCHLPCVVSVFYSSLFLVIFISILVSPLNAPLCLAPVLSLNSPWLFSLLLTCTHPKPNLFAPSVLIFNTHLQLLSYILPFVTIPGMHLHCIGLKMIICHIINTVSVWPLCYLSALFSYNAKLIIIGWWVSFTT